MARKSRKNTTAAAPAEVRQTKTRLGGYVRLSAIDRKQKGDSIENQQSIIHAYIAEHPDLELVEMYIDNGVTGQTFDRPAFQRMLADLEDGKIAGCVSKDLSRLGRNSIDTGYYIEKYFPTRGFRYIAINDNYDSADGQSGGIMVSLRNLINETYALEVGRKIRATKQMQIKNGCFVGQYAPYGYIKNPNDCHSLIVEPIASRIVRHIFDMAAGGESDMVILEWLNESRILPPRQHLHAIGVLSEKQVTEQMLWNIGAVRTILQNVVYVGDMAQGKKRTKSHVTTLNLREDWIVTPNTHEAIVSREIFGKVQARRGTGTVIGKTLDERRKENPLIRKIFCGYCGHPLIRRSERNGWKSHFYCATRQKYGADKCRPNRITEYDLHCELLALLRKQTVVFTDKRGSVPAVTVSENNAEVQSVQAELARVSGFLKGLYESLIEGDISKTEYADMKQGYESRISALNERERKIRDEIRERYMRESALKKTGEQLDNISVIGELTADVADALIEKIIVFNGNHIEVTFKFTDETVMVGGEAND